jgi:hypothetical protein
MRLKCVLLKEWRSPSTDPHRQFGNALKNWRSTGCRLQSSFEQPPDFSHIAYSLFDKLRNDNEDKF